MFEQRLRNRGALGSALATPPIRGQVSSLRDIKHAPKLVVASELLEDSIERGFSGRFAQRRPKWSHACSTAQAIQSTALFRTIRFDALRA